MDLKFSFGGASPHDHGDAPSGFPLPFSGHTPSSSSELDVVVRSDDAHGPRVIAEVITGDGVTYARGEVSVATGSDDRSAATARAARSAISRAVAGLEGPLARAITSVELRLPGASSLLPALGIDPAAPTVTEDLQMRVGIESGVPIRIAQA